MNPSAASENRIHEDGTARAYGFRGGLVPGVMLWAYLTHPVMRAFGGAFLGRGGMHVRLRRPVYEGDTIECTAVPDGDDRVLLRLLDSSGALCAEGEAWVAATGDAPPPHDPYDVREAEPPAERPPASARTLAPGTTLGSLRETFRADRAPEFLDMLGDTLPLYREAAVAHPGWLVWKANTVLVTNVVLGPWIHVETTARHHGAVHDGDVVVTRARVVDRFERKGHQFVDLAVLQTVGDRPVVSIDHRAIYELRPSTGGS